MIPTRMVVFTVNEHQIACPPHDLLTLGSRYGQVVRRRNVKRLMRMGE